MWVVKLGGSLWRSRELIDWLDQLGKSRQPLIVVPGGGPFADQVRAAQARLGFDDVAAHTMALLAMERMAHVLCALNPRLIAFEDVDALNGILERGHVGVWLASRMTLEHPSIKADWDVTSDSLAVWLAGRIGALGLLLVKSANMPNGAANLSDLQRSGLLDRAFHRYADGCECPLRMAHRGQSEAFPAMLGGGSPALVLKR